MLFFLYTDPQMNAETTFVLAQVFIENPVLLIDA